MTKDPFTPQALDVLCREAGRQAAGWGAGQAAAANAAPASWLTLGLIGGGSVLAVVVLASSLLDEPALPRSAHPAAMQTQAAAEAPLHTPEANAPAQPIRWEGDDLVIDLDRVALTDAVALLARATGTSLTGAHLLTAPTRLTLHLRTRDVNAAWQHLLQGHASFSTSCSATACQVWISSEIAASSLPPNAAPADDGRAPLLESEREPMTDERREELVSQPDGAC